MKAAIKVMIFSFLLIFLLPSALAITYNATQADGSIIESRTHAAGYIAQHDANQTSDGTEAIVFGWGGPVGNGTNNDSVGVSDLGVSEAGDIYIITFGPDFSEDIIVEDEDDEEEVDRDTSGVPSSGGGGGGSSSTETYGLLVGDKLTFLIGGEPYSVSIDALGEADATLTFVEQEETFTLFVGEAKIFDVDKNNQPDFSVQLDRITDLNKVVITIQDLTKEVVEYEAQTEEETEETVDEAKPLEAVTGMVTQGADAVTGAVAGIDVEQTVERGNVFGDMLKSGGMYLLTLNVVVGILIGGLFAAHQVQRRRIASALNEKSRGDIVKEGFGQIESFARNAFAQGYTHEQIRASLLKAGWLREEVDEALVDIMLEQENRFFN